jgi:hypothetical protein
MADLARSASFPSARGSEPAPAAAMPVVAGATSGTGAPVARRMRR